ncbi:peptide/nickel transport system permease protein [Nocardioides exalbidus]|uniref:Peptide/nickel transport system permease protein n=1 Tax=Nocardioides exalbidus TaxID=402596 RepID=A0A1H4L453_9ACTN|nr:ABC transporter permease [Nocardioides exalbidus]SEB65549.1 peptide/nickel transport system permease protein [Nocardioides exalbidus]
MSLTVAPDTGTTAPDAPPPAPGPSTATEVVRPRRVVPLVRAVAGGLAVAVTVLLLASVIAFALGALSDSNPAAAVLGETATPEDIARMNHEFGLDRPLVEQYVSWVGSAVQGDLGRSWFTTIPVADSIKQALPVDLSIAALALVLAILIGGGSGIGAALSNGGFFDRVVTLVCSVLATLPPFVIGMALIVIFSVKLQLLPSGGYVPIDQDPAQWLRFSILPSLALSLDVAASIARQLRTSMVTALGENYAIGAEMRGYGRSRVLFGHVLRNAAAPTLAVIGLAIPLIVGGAVITERLFGLPGVAQLALQSAERGDVPVVLGTLLVTAVVVVVASSLVNVLQKALDPTARREGALR